jgi:hypothetical protein
VFVLSTAGKLIYGFKKKEVTSSSFAKIKKFKKRRAQTRFDARCSSGSSRLHPIPCSATFVVTRLSEVSKETGKREAQSTTDTVQFNRNSNWQKIDLSSHSSSVFTKKVVYIYTFVG